MSDPRRNRAQLLVGAVIVAVAVAGCGAGQITQTSRQVAAVEGANVTAGQIAVRNAVIEFDGPAEGAAVYPVGGNAPLQMSIVNSGAEVDRLVAASSPVADSVQISGVLRIPGGQALDIEGAPATAAPAAAEPTPVAAPPAAEAPAGVGSIVLTGLREDVRAGLTYPLILTFERAGELRFDVPVANPETLREDAAH